MIRTKQMLGYLGVSALALGAAMPAFAVDETVEVDAQFRVALTLTENNQVDFTPGTGSIDYSDVANIDNTADYIQLATNDALTPAGRITTSLTNGQAGQVTIAGEPSTGVSISCLNTGMVLSETGTGFDLNFVEARVSADAAGTGDAYGSADHVCAGLGTTPYTGYTLSVGGAGIVTIGGRINGEANMPSAVYSSANTGDGGVPFQLRVIYTP